MSHRLASWLASVLILGLATFICFRDIGHTPIYLGGDEAHFAVHAYSIASTGRDLNGHVMPLFFNLVDPLGDQDTPAIHRWYQPTLLYLTALTLKVLPLTEASVRTPTALIGVLDALLIYAVARRLFPGWLYPAIAALVLALSPAHVILSRQATDYICSLPFVLGWLWCLAASLEADRVWLSLSAGLLLGVGLYSYIAAWVLMPFYLLVTWIVQRQAGRGFRLSLATGLGFVMPLLILAPWLWSHPEMLRDTFGRYGLSDARHATVLPAVKGFFRLGSIRDKMSVYWDYFDPTFLFVTGGASLTTATGKSGVFLLPVAVFLPAGVYTLLKRRSSAAIRVLLLAGLASAPIPAALMGERYMIQREMFVVPFGALIATFGVVFLLQHPDRATRVMAVLLLAAMPLQFAHFYRDYFAQYRTRSAFFFDSGNFREVAEYLISADSSGHVPAMYLSRQLDDGSPRWRFYLTKYHREDLLQRTSYFDGDGLDLGGVATDSLIVLYADDHKLAALLDTGKWSVEKTVVDVAGNAASVILRKAS